MKTFSEEAKKIDYLQKELETLGFAYSKNDLKLVSTFPKDEMIKEIYHVLNWNQKHMQRIGETGKREFLISTLLNKIFIAFENDLSNLTFFSEYRFRSENFVGNFDYLLKTEEKVIITEAKKDDFDLGMIQIALEMIEYQKQEGDEKIHGIVTNGNGWIFCDLINKEFIEYINLFTITDIYGLQQIVHHICRVLGIDKK